MRIKTSSKVENLLDELKSNLNMTTKAEVLLLAINLSLNTELTILNNLEEDGFEVDTRLIFEDNHAYYDLLIKEFYNVEAVNKVHYLNLIEEGIILLNNEIKKSRSNNTQLLDNLLRSV